MDLQPYIHACIDGVRVRDAIHPTAIFVLGPIAAGKTVFRKKKFAKDRYVQIDSADIFHALSKGDATLDFPAAFAKEIEHVGRAITKTAIENRLDLVLEAPGHDADVLIRAINGLKAIGYVPEIETLATDRDTCERQHAMRGDSVSSYWASPIHLAWVIDECAKQLH
jgi:Zeta toxin